MSRARGASITSQTSNNTPLNHDGIDLETFDSMLGDEDFVNIQLNKPRYTFGQWLKENYLNGVLILCWYVSSVSLSMFNKWMFAPSMLDFGFPLITTSYHQLVQFLLSYITLSIYGLWKEKNSMVVLEHEQIKPFRYYLSWNYLRVATPCGLASSGDIGLGNVSLGLITLTFYTVIKSSALGFVLLFGVLFGLEILTLELVAIVGTMTVGVILMAVGGSHGSENSDSEEHQRHSATLLAIGLVAVLGASVCSGLRWCLTQMLLKGRPARLITSWRDIIRPSAERNNAVAPNSNTKHNPLQTILMLAPIMGFALFLLGLCIEGPFELLKSHMWEEKGIIKGLLLVSLPGAIAFLMTLSEFFLLERTSVLALSIAGIFKEIVTLGSAALGFGDTLSMSNAIGLTITVSAIIAYNVYRIREKNLEQ